MNSWNPPVHQTTTGPLCAICGGAVITATGHGWGICRSPERASVERYIGVTPDQVRQIIREELAKYHLIAIRDPMD